MSKTLLIGDTHFGIKTNSTVWLGLQLKFYRSQIIEAAISNNVSKIVFLGDLFDIRYSINQIVGLEVVRMFREFLEKLPDTQFYMLAGNHDFFSPLEEFSEYNAYNLMFNDEFLEKHKNLHLVTVDPEIDNDGALYLPWYWTEDIEKFDQLLYAYKLGVDVKCIYCHADLSAWPGSRISSLKGIPVYSGHIHNIIEDSYANLYNVGACCALTFNDVNQERYIYIIDNESSTIVGRIQNDTTPKFKTICNDDIFKADESVFNNSYVKICIYNKNYRKAKYVEQLKAIKSKYISSNITVNVIDDDIDLGMTGAQGLSTNINKYIDDNMPKHLEPKYEMIKKKISEEK